MTAAIPQTQTGGGLLGIGVPTWKLRQGHVLDVLRAMPQPEYEAYQEDDKHATATHSILEAVKLWDRKHPGILGTTVLVSQVDFDRWKAEGGQAPVRCEVKVSERVRPNCYFGGVE